MTTVVFTNSSTRGRGVNVAQNTVVGKDIRVINGGGSSTFALGSTSDTFEMSIDGLRSEFGSSPKYCPIGKIPSAQVSQCTAATCSPYHYVFRVGASTWPWAESIYRPGSSAEEWPFCGVIIGHVVGQRDPAVPSRYTVAVTYNTLTVSVPINLAQNSVVTVSSSDATFLGPTTVVAGAFSVTEVPDNIVFTVAAASKLPTFPSGPPIPAFSFLSQPNASSPDPVPWAEGTALSWPLTYAPTTGYAYKQFAQVTATYNNDVIKVSIDANAERNLGFGFETFGAGGGPFTAPGFYDGVSAALVPYAVFTVGNKYGTKVLRAVNNGLQAVNGNQYLASCLFTFVPDANGNMQLVFLDAGSPTGYRGMSVKNNALAGPEYVDNIASGSPGGQWGVRMTPLRNTAYIVYRDGSDGEVHYLLNAWAGDTGAQLVPASKRLTFTTVNPPGFLSGDPDAAGNECRLCLLPSGLVDSIPFRYFGNCWAATPYGCDGNNGTSVCVAGLTQAGQTTCKIQGSLLFKAAYVEGAADFASKQCAFAYTGMGDCKGVSGTPTSTCSGWKLSRLSLPCAQACAVLNEANPQACDTLKREFCAAPGNANLGDCACINVAASTFRVQPYNLSYLEFVRGLVAKFGLNDHVDLSPNCWWPACSAEALEGGLHLSTEGVACTGASDLKDCCPEYVVRCLTYVKDFQIKDDADIALNIEQNCGVRPLAPWDAPAAAPGSGCMLPLRQSGVASLAQAGAAGLASPPKFNSSSVFVIGLLCLAGVVFLGIDAFQGFKLYKLKRAARV